VILYHGSYIEIEKPDLSKSRSCTDFGKGFYLTPIKEQAMSWSQRFLSERGSAVVSRYEFLPKPDDRLSDDVRIFEFDTHNLDWLNFITAYRLGKALDTEWDLVIGGVANDKVFNTLQLYFDELISADEAIGRLRYSKPNYQYCFKRQSVIDEYLVFVGAEMVK
jgi:hypothetical protein